MDFLKTRGTIKRPMYPIKEPAFLSPWFPQDDKQKLKVFDRNGVYLPTKKIGKNNPKAEQIRTDNQYRTMWNQTVDRALISGVRRSRFWE